MPDAKRILDLAIGVPALLVSLPLQAVVALAVRLRLGRPVLFRQERAGLHGVPFTMVKFRTMLEKDDGRVEDEDRMTALGAFLRATSLDELPALRHVVVGQMALVGPRPLLVHYLERYTPEQARRHDVRPGLTGLAQVSGRNSLAWEKRLALDVEYVDTNSTTLDLQILARTVTAVLSRRGVSAEGTVTMTEFTGRPEGVAR